MRSPLWQIGEYPFQDLTVELFAKDPVLENARLHGGRGHRQFGADVTAGIRIGGVLAASCKCSQVADISLIQQACDEFDKHHEYWKNEDCWHLVVVLAGYVDNPKDQKKYDTGKKFTKSGVSFLVTVQVPPR